MTTLANDILRRLSIGIVTIALGLGAGTATAFHLDIVVGESGGRLQASFCPPGDAGCDSVPALSALGLPAGQLPVHGATGTPIFVTDFGDFAGGPFATDDPGFFADPGTLPPDVLLRYEITEPLRFWDAATGNWTEQTPADERIRLAGGIAVVPNGSCGLLICFEPGSTVITDSGVEGEVSLVIDQTGANGSLHTHLDWFIERPDGSRGGSTGAYTLELLIAGDGYASSAPLMLLFNRGLGDAAFGDALLGLVNAAPPPPPGPGALVAWPAGVLQVDAGTRFDLADAAAGAVSPFVLTTLGLGGGGEVRLGGNELRVSPGTDMLFSGSISGTGAFTKLGDARLSLTGSSSYSGDTRVNGPLRINDDRNLGAPASSLYLDGAVLELAADVDMQRRLHIDSASSIDTGAHALRLNGDFDGAADVRKRGSGELRINGARDFSGIIDVAEGGLYLDGALRGGVRMAAGTRLGGRAELGGDLHLGPGANYQVNVRPGGIDGGVFSTAGRIRIDGAYLRIDGVAGDYPLASEHRILSAAGGVSGAFAAIENNLAFLDPALRYSANAVDLRLLRNDVGFADFVADPGHAGVAAALDSLSAAGNGAAATALRGLRADQVAGVLNSVSGLSLTALPGAGGARARAGMRQLGVRLAHVAPGGAGGTLAGLDPSREVLLAMAGRAGQDPVLAAASRAAARLAPQPRHGAWVRGLAGVGDFELGAGVTADSEHAGLLFGYDWQASRWLTAGLFGMYTDAEINQGEPQSGTGITSWQTGGYARLNGRRWHVDAIAGYGRDRYHSVRQLAFGGLASNATARFDGSNWNLYVEAAWNPATLPWLQPWLALQWNRQQQDDYREAGAAGLGLAVAAAQNDSLRSLLGARIRTDIGRIATGAVTAELRLAWAHEFSDDAGLRARLLGDPAATLFTVPGRRTPNHSAVLGAGVVAALNEHASAFADFDGEVSSAQRSWALSAGVRLHW